MQQAQVLASLVKQSIVMASLELRPEAVLASSDMQPIIGAA
jgi:hypothetical protein